VNGETARKKPLSAPLSRPWSLSAEIVTISLQDSPRLLRQSFGSRCRRRPRSRCSPPRVLLLQTRSWSCIPGRISPSDRAGVELRGGCRSRTPYWQYTISRRRRRVSTVSSSHDTAVPFLWGSLPPCSPPGRNCPQSEVSPSDRVVAVAPMRPQIRGPPPQGPISNRRPSAG
jgi:hypothetical protein